MKNILFFSLGLLLYTSCGTSTSKEASEQQVAAADLTEHPGYKLYQMYCMACHGNMAGPDQRLAPPAFMVSKRYHQIFNNKEDFTKRVVTWVNNTSQEDAKMPGAVRNFDVMPALNLSLKDRESIADYFYETKFEEPAWMAAHMEQERKSGKMQMMDSLMP